jgi:hypothetical protein
MTYFCGKHYPSDSVSQLEVGLRIDQSLSTRDKAHKKQARMSALCPPLSSESKAAPAPIKARAHADWPEPQVRTSAVQPYSST